MCWNIHEEMVKEFKKIKIKKVLKLLIKFHLKSHPKICACGEYIPNSMTLNRRNRLEFFSTKTG